jgi:hypothetical protein
MHKRLKRGLYGLTIALLIFGIARLYFRLTDDFRRGNISYQLPFEAPWKVPMLNSEEHQQLTHILNQKFFYIGKGAQCYAFVSDDQQYVLKFFKFKHLKPNAFVDFLPAVFPFKNYKQSIIERKKRKLIGVFNGYDLAYREHRQDSELLYLHLLPTQHLKLSVTVVDKIGIERHINLDDVVFLVQKKGETLRTRLKELLKQGRLQDAKHAMSSILAMYISEYQKGIFDHDHGVLHNTGFVENKPFHLDVGKLNKDDRIRQVDFYKKDLEHVVWKMDVWVKASFPEYYLEISDFLAQEYQRWTGEILDIKAIDPKRFKKRR